MWVVTEGQGLVRLNQDDRETLLVLQLTEELIAETSLRLTAKTADELNRLIQTLSRLETHKPIAADLGRLFLALELAKFPSAQVLNAISKLHAIWQLDGIHPDSSTTLLELFNRAKFQIDDYYTMGRGSLFIAIPLIALLFFVGVPLIYMTPLIAVYGIGLTTGNHVLQKVNAVRKELEEMRAEVKRLLPPLRHRQLQTQRLKQLESGEEHNE